jgi:hypothetical protein
MGSLRQAGKQLKKAKRRERRDLKGRVDQNEMLRLGDAPRLKRNPLLEETWDHLLSDPSVAHSDINRWRKGADVRPSSFPFCGRKYVLNRLGLTMPDDFDVSSNFYTEIGKAVHYVGQNAFARTGRLWGFWLCARPTCEDRVQHKPYSDVPGFYPKGETCSSCGSRYFEYEELVIRDARIGLRGHCDGVLVFKKYSSVLEIKTALPDKVKALQDADDDEISDMFATESPWYGYWHQASTYASLLRMKYPSLPPIKRVDFFVCARDKPDNVVSLSMDVPADNSWWKEIRSRIIMSQQALRLEIVPAGFAKTKEDLDALPTCKWCTHKEVCLSPKGKVDFRADALYDTQADQELIKILAKERSKWVESSVET